MTEPTDDGWPEKYSDPRDRPHPASSASPWSCSTRCVRTPSTLSKRSPRARSSPRSSRSAPSGSCRRSSRTVASNSPKRIATEGAAESISAFAEALDRDYHTVHDDVSLLADYGLLFIVEDGQAKRPFLPYERIHLDVELVGGRSGEEPAPA
jgi:hypothetical protein